jgi:hypothetical protein
MHSNWEKAFRVYRLKGVLMQSSLGQIQSASLPLPADTTSSNQQIPVQDLAVMAELFQAFDMESIELDLLETTYQETAESTEIGWVNLFA